MDTKQITIYASIAIVCLILGGLIGLGFGAKIGAKNIQPEKIETANNLSSKVVTTITGFGEITNISGSNITLNNLGDNLVVSIPENAKIYSINQDQQTIKFQDLKQGERVNVSLRVMPSGKFEASAIIVLP